MLYHFSYDKLMAGVVTDVVTSVVISVVTRVVTVDAIRTAVD